MQQTALAVSLRCTGWLRNVDLPPCRLLACKIAEHWDVLVGSVGADVRLTATASGEHNRAAKNESQTVFQQFRHNFSGLKVHPYLLRSFAELLGFGNYPEIWKCISLSPGAHLMRVGHAHVVHSTISRNASSPARRERVPAWGRSRRTRSSRALCSCWAGSQVHCAAR